MGGYAKVLLSLCCKNGWPRSSFGEPFKGKNDSSWGLVVMSSDFFSVVSKHMYCTLYVIEYYFSQMHRSFQLARYPVARVMPLS